MIDAMTSEDLGVILAGLSFALIGALSIYGSLAVEGILFTVLITAGLYISFIMGTRHGQPRRS